MIKRYENQTQEDLDLLYTDITNINNKVKEVKKKLNNNSYLVSSTNEDFKYTIKSCELAIKLVKSMPNDRLLIPGIIERLEFSKIQASQWKGCNDESLRKHILNNVIPIFKTYLSEITNNLYLIDNNKTRLNELLVSISKL